MQIFVNFLSTVLVSLYSVVGNMGLSIILFTILIRTLLIPLTLPSLKARKKITELKPELDKLKKKHGDDKKALQMAQVELYKKYNVNPLSGCIPQLVQFFILISLYRSMTSFLGDGFETGIEINNDFLWFNLTQPDNKFILPILAGLFQFIMALMIAPGGEVRDIVPNQSKSKKVQKENAKEEDMAGMAATMQKQMLFVMPVMTGFVAARFPAGLALYWIITTLFSIGQQYLISGLGGLKTYLLRLKLISAKKV
jgi:YidC/Oxa1 family membrane protein insertase